MDQKQKNEAANAADEDKKESNMDPYGLPSRDLLKKRPRKSDQPCNVYSYDPQRYEKRGAVIFLVEHCPRKP